MIWISLGLLIGLIILRRRKKRVYKVGQVLIEHYGGHVEIWEMQENKMYVIIESGKYSCLVDVYNNMKDYKNNVKSGIEEYTYDYLNRYCNIVEL